MLTSQILTGNLRVGSSMTPQSRFSAVRICELSPFRLVVDQVERLKDRRPRIREQELPSPVLSDASPGDSCLPDPCRLSRVVRFVHEDDLVGAGTAQLDDHLVH